MFRSNKRRIIKLLFRLEWRRGGENSQWVRRRWLWWTNKSARACAAAACDRGLPYLRYGQLTSRTWRPPPLPVHAASCAVESAALINPT